MGFWPWKKRPVIYDWGVEFAPVFRVVIPDPTPATFSITMPDNEYGRIISIELVTSTDAIAATRQVTVSLIRSGHVVARGLVLSATTSLRQWIFSWFQVANVVISTGTVTSYTSGPLYMPCYFLPGDVLTLTAINWQAGDVFSKFTLTYERNELY